MFESIPTIISVIVFSLLMGGMIGSAISKMSYSGNKKSRKGTHVFDIDKTTGIVSDVTFVKYK